MGQSQDKNKALTGQGPTLSYKEAADLVGVSERTIRRHAELMPKLAYGQTKGNKRMLRTDWLIKEFPDAEKNKKDMDMAEKMSEDVAYLKEIIAEKDRQIRDKDQQINKLIDQEEKSKILLAQASEERKSLQNLLETSKTEGKKGFFSRLFGK